MKKLFLIILMSNNPILFSNESSSSSSATSSVSRSLALPSSSSSSYSTASSESTSTSTTTSSSTNSTSSGASDPVYQEYLTRSTVRISYEQWQKNGQELIQSVKNDGITKGVDNTDKIMELLYSGQVDTNTKDKYGNTALFYANSKEMTELLISHGAHIDITSMDGFTPMMYQALRSFKETRASEVLNRYINWIPTEYEFDYSTLEDIDSVAIVKLLLDKGADINRKHGTGYFAKNVLELILVRLSAYNAMGKDLKKISKPFEIIKLVIEYGCIIKERRIGNVKITSEGKIIIYKKSMVEESKINEDKALITKNEVI